MSRPVFLPLALALASCTALDEGESTPRPSPPPLINPLASVLVAPGAAWRFSDRGVTMPDGWYLPGFDDSTDAWSSGPAPLGYGEDDVATRLSFGDDPENKFITTYFRTSFTVEAPSAYDKLQLFLWRDDGAIVYLNGAEVTRTNLPPGQLLFQSSALRPVDGSEERRVFTFDLDPALLVAGDNTVAVELHQAGPASPDARFDLALAARGPIVRGPYLQRGTPTSAIVHFRTESAVATRVSWGTTLGQLAGETSEPEALSEHAVVLEGLAPATTYYYAISRGETVLTGGTASYTFTTPPAPGTPATTRIWAVGDSGTANTNAFAVRDSYGRFAGQGRTDVWLMLGDNAYLSGTDADYQRAVFETFPALLRRTFLWPTIGNHDTDGFETVADSQLPYLAMFDLPKGGEAGGVPSGSERYYSFDHGDIHFVCLDSMSSSRARGGAMLSWLAADLAARTSRWLIAYWHHPPYSKGSHDSDYEPPMVQMRENVLPVLEAGGVDLVLSGHSHGYERSYLLDGHYGLSSTFAATMKKQAGPGDEAEPYRKSAVPHAGAVYVVAGSGGQVSGGSLNHPAMLVSFPQLGSLVIDVDGDRLDARFLRETGAVDDHFTIVKP